MKFIEAQFLSTLARALRDHAVIVSGAYKQSTTQQGVELTDEEKAQGKEPWRDLTEDEKLAQAVQTLTTRCHWLNEIAEHIVELNKEDEESKGSVYEEIGREFLAFLKKKDGQ